MVTMDPHKIFQDPHLLFKSRKTGLPFLSLFERTRNRKGNERGGNMKIEILVNIVDRLASTLVVYFLYSTISTSSGLYFCWYTLSPSPWGEKVVCFRWRKKVMFLSCTLYLYFMTWGERIAGCRWRKKVVFLSCTFYLYFLTWSDIIAGCRLRKNVLFLSCTLYLYFLTWGERIASCRWRKKVVLLFCTLYLYFLTWGERIAGCRWRKNVVFLFWQSQSISPWGRPALQLSSRRFYIFYILKGFRRWKRIPLKQRQRSSLLVGGRNCF